MKIKDESKNTESKSCFYLLTFISAWLKSLTKLHAGFPRIFTYCSDQLSRSVHHAYSGGGIYLYVHVIYYSLGWCLFFGVKLLVGICKTWADWCKNDLLECFIWFFFFFLWVGGAQERDVKGKWIKYIFLNYFNSIL